MTWVMPFYAMPPVVLGDNSAPDTFTPDRMVWHNNNICQAGESIPLPLPHQRRGRAQPMPQLRAHVAGRVTWSPISPLSAALP
jgi:hypothetical protein